MRLVLPTALSPSRTIFFLTAMNSSSSPCERIVNTVFRYFFGNEIEKPEELDLSEPMDLTSERPRHPPRRYTSSNSFLSLNIISYDMTQTQELADLDVSLSMTKDIEVLQKVIGTIDIENREESKKALEQIYKKVAEIEEYFWRPIDSIEVYEKLKALALELGDNEKAAKFDSKIKLFNANELEFKGRVQDFFGNKVKAIEYYEDALELVPDHELAFPAHEKALKSINKAKTDLSQAEKKLEAESADPKLWFKRGVALLYLGKVDEAIDSLDKAIKFDPANPDALAKRGTAMECLGDFEGSKEYFEKALEIKSTSMTAKRGLNYANYFLENK
jgi:tetratricopeptide (TPR) repeat protein